MWQLFGLARQNVQFKWSCCDIHYYTLLVALRLNLLVHFTEIFSPCFTSKVLSPTRIQALRDHISWTEQQDANLVKGFLVKWLAIFSFVHSEVYRIRVSLGLNRIQSLTTQNMPKHKHPFCLCLNGRRFIELRNVTVLKSRHWFRTSFSFRCRLQKQGVVLKPSTGQNLVFIPHRLAFVT